MKSILIFCFCILNVFLVKAQQQDAVHFYSFAGGPNYYTSSNQIYTSSFLSSGGEVLNGRTIRHNLNYSFQTSLGDFLGGDYSNFTQLQYNFQIGIKGKHQIDFSASDVAVKSTYSGNRNISSIPLSLKYHYQLFNDKYYFQIAPIISLIYSRQFFLFTKPEGIFGYDVTIPISKKVGKHFSFRYNIGLNQYRNYKYMLHQYGIGEINTEKRNPMLLKNGLNITYNLKNKLLFFAEAEHRNFNQYNFDVNSNLQLNNKTKWQRNIGLMYVSNIKKAKLMYSINVPQFLNTYEMGIILGLTYQHKY